MGFRAVCAEVTIACLALDKFTLSTWFAHGFATLCALDKIFLVNCLVLAALIACSVLPCTAPHRIRATAIAINRVHPAINIIAYSRLASNACMRTWLTTLTRHLLG